MTKEIEAFIEAFDGKVKVVAEKYEGDCSPNYVEAFGYKGKDLLTIMVKIDETHSYGHSVDEDNLKILDVIDEIDGSNGDGCDFILTMETGGVTLTLGTVDEDEVDEDDYEDCDEDE